eukprot:1017400-Amphidinium_carterae.1
MKLSTIDQLIYYSIESKLVTRPVPRPCTLQNLCDTVCVARDDFAALGFEAGTVIKGDIHELLFTMLCLTKYGDDAECHGVLRPFKGIEVSGDSPFVSTMAARPVVCVVTFLAGNWRHLRRFAVVASETGLQLTPCCWWYHQSISSGAISPLSNEQTRGRKYLDRWEQEDNRCCPLSNARPMENSIGTSRETCWKSRLSWEKRARRCMLCFSCPLLPSS